MRLYKIILLIVLSLYAPKALAFYYEKVSYEVLDDKTCSTESSDSRNFPGNTGFSGKLIIPALVKDTKNAYSVTQIGTLSFNIGWDYDPTKKPKNQITSVVIPNTVTTINEGAFAENPLETIIIGENVTSINGYAFYGLDCYSCDVYFLAKIPPMIDGKHMYYAIFSGEDRKGMFCGKNTTIHVPFGYKAAYEASEWNQNGRKIVDDADVVILDGIAYKYDVVTLNSNTKAYTVHVDAYVAGVADPTITKATFRTSITTPFGQTLEVKGIEDGAFRNNTTLQEVIIPDGITTIGDYAFAGSSLSKITMGNTVWRIGERAFANCEGLKTIGISQSVTEIGAWAFSSCSNLEYVMLGKGIQTIGQSAFDSCNNIKEVEVEDLASWCAVDLGDSSANPMKISQGFSIKGIPQNVLNIPEGVTDIKPYTFYNCKSITDLSVSSTVRSILDCAFSNSGIVKIENTANITKIGSLAFSSCRGLESVVLSSKVYEVADGAFMYCAGLKTLKIEGFVNEVGDFAFFGCKSLTNIDLCRCMYNIGKDAFHHCEALTEVNVAMLEDWLYQSYASQYSNPLYYARRLKVNGEEIKNLNVIGRVDKINQWAFYRCNSLETVTISEKIKTIGNYAFSECEALKDLSTGNGVKTIGEGAFKGDTNLESVNFGENIETIGAEMFVGCINLRNVMAKMSRAPVQTERCFDDVVYSNATLYVEPSCYSTYRITEPWSGFRQIKEYGIYYNENALGFYNGRKRLKLGEIFKMDVTTQPPTLHDNLEWTSSSLAVEILDKGVLRAALGGSAEITISAGGISTYFYVDVVIPAEAIYLNRDEVQLSPNETVTLEATVEPSNADNKKVYWTSSDRDIASVNNGVVTAQSKTGTAIITASTANGLTAECRINVVIPVTGLTFDNAAMGIEDGSLHMNPGETRKLAVVVYPSNSNEKLRWGTYDEKIARVNDGVVEAIAPGMTYISVDADNAYAYLLVCVDENGALDSVVTDDDTEFEIYNVQGQCLKAKAKKRDIKSLAPGVYIVRKSGRVEKICVK